MRTSRSILAVMLATALLFTSAAPAVAAPSVLSVSFAGLDGYLAGYRYSGNLGFVSVTRDGGQSWVATTTPYLMESVSAGPSGKAWALPVLDDWALYSGDFGVAWTQKSLSGNWTPTKRGVAFGSQRSVIGGQVSSDHGDLAYLITSPNPDTPWSEQFRGPIYIAPNPENPDPVTSASFEAVDSAPGGSVLWAAGNEFGPDSITSYTRALAFRSTDGGVTFAEKPVKSTSGAWVKPASPRITGVAAIDANQAFLCGAGHAIRTTDGGTSWTATQLPYLWVGSQRFVMTSYGIDSTSASNVVIVGANITSTSGQLLAGSALFTRFNGTTWEAPRRITTVNGVPATVGILRSISMVDADSWVVVGDDETVLRTDDAGATWSGTVAPAVPAVTMTSPTLDEASTGSWTAITGSASDTGVGVQSVNVSVRRQSDLKYWNGVSWMPNQSWLPASQVGGSWANWRLDFDALPGSYTVTARAMDGLGLTKDVTVVGAGGPVDTVPPSTPAIDVIGDSTAEVSVSMTSTDLSGEPTIKYRVNSGVEQTYTGPISFKNPGSYTITAIAEDPTGNQSPQSSRTFKVVAIGEVPATVQRVGGSNRYDVAINLAVQLRAQRGKPFSDVIVACGEDRAMADPLGAAALAGAYEAPVLLTPSAKPNQGTLDYIASLRNANGGKIDIHVVGGTTSIPTTVYNKLAALKGTGTAERIDAPNRYALAQKMAQRVGSVMKEKGQPVTDVLIVNIENPASWNDALAASPMSARAHMPLIGVRGSSVPAEAWTALASLPNTTRIAVNSAYLTSKVRTDTLCSAVMASNSNRETAATQIAQFGRSNSFVSYANVGLANKLSDALPAGAVIGQLDGVMVYTGASPLSATTKNFCVANKASIDKGWVFGGTTTIADTTKSAFLDSLK